MAKSCEEGTYAGRRFMGSKLGASKDFHWGISVKMYPSSSDLLAQDQFGVKCIG